MAKVDGWGEVLPGFYLVRATHKGDSMNVGDWGLVESNDPTFIWSIDLHTDPLFGATDAEVDASEEEVWEESCLWSEVAVSKFEKELVSSIRGQLLDQLYRLGKALSKVSDIGIHIVLGEFLFQYLARVIEDSPNPIEPWNKQ